MITYLIITGIVILIISTLNIFPLRRKGEKLPLVYIKNRPNYLDELAYMLASINFGGFEMNVIPGATGEFGYTVTNPIPVCRDNGSLTYLQKLRTVDGKIIQFKLLRTTKAKNIKHKIYQYEIAIENEKVANLFICPFYVANSSKAPYGLKIIKE